MEKNILLEINRMNELMGLSNLVSEGVEPQLIKFLEKVFATGGEKGIEKVVTKVEQEVTDAISTLERQKNYGGVPTQEVEKAYEAIAKSLNSDELVKFLKDYNLLGEFEKGVKELSKKIEQQGSSLEVWEKNIDEFIDNATEGMNPELRNSLKKELKKDAPLGLKKVSTLSGEVLEKMKSQFPELFEMKWFGMVEKYPEKINVLKTQIESDLKGLTKEQALGKLKKDGEEMVQAVKKSKLTEPDKNKILQWWNGLSTGKKVFKIVTTALAITLIYNWTQTGGFWSSVGKTGGDVGKEIYKGFKSSSDSTSTSTSAPSTSTVTPRRTRTADDY